MNIGVVDFMDKVKEILLEIGQILIIIWNYIVLGVSAASEWIGDYFCENIAPMMPTMMKFFSNRKINIVIFCVIFLYILIINICAFSMFGHDKKCAKRKERRISEAKLIKICFFGGAIGGLLGMNVFRHKTLKTKFKIIVPVLFVIQLILHSFVLGFLGFWAFF